MIDPHITPADIERAARYLADTTGHPGDRRPFMQHSTKIKQELRDVATSLYRMIGLKILNNDGKEI